MAFPASQPIPAAGLLRAQTTALSVKTLLERINADSLAGDVPRTKLISVMGQLNASITILNDAAAIPGVAQYAKDQFNDQSFDIAAEFTTMVAAITTLRDWIFSNFPKDTGSGAWLAQLFNNAGVATELSFTTAELADYRTNADAVIATIG